MTIFNVKDYPGTDYAAFTAAIAAAKAAGGGVVYAPAGNYDTSAGTILIDNSSDTARFQNRVTIKGDGSATTVISCGGLASPAFSYIGTPAYSEGLLHFEGIRITGSNTIGSTGLKIATAAFVTSEDLYIEAFDYNLDCIDVEQSQFENSYFRWGYHGVQFSAGIANTDPNSIVFNNCSISNNLTWGLNVTHANAFTMIGGSIQYNGSIGGGSSQWGAKFTEAGTGYGTVNFLGVAFEGNGGDGDLISDQTVNPAVFNIIGNGFARTGIRWGTNFLSIRGSNAKSTYNLSGNEFCGYGTYVPSAARPYISVTNPNAKVFDDGSNVYGSPVEQPAWAGAVKIPANVIIGAGGAPIGPLPFIVHAGVDHNFYTGGNFHLPDGIALGAINDANSALMGVELRASKLAMSGMAGASVLTVAGYLSGAVAYDPPALADGAGTTTTVTVSGAALGDVALASFSLTTSGITITAWVSAANTVSVRFQNESGGALDIGSGTLKAVVIK